MTDTKPFTHLHVHTQFSLLDGSAKIKELVARAKELGMDSLAITDHGVMYGVIDFYKAAKEVGIKPIIGCEVYVASKSRFDKTNASDNFYYHLVLLAENMEGYYNLVKLVSYGFTEGFYYKPRVDIELLKKYHKGLIASSACLAGPVAKDFMRSGYDKALETAKTYSNIFGENNFFLELQDHGMPEQQQVNQALLRIHEETGLPLICTNDSHYINAEDADAHDVLLCIQTGVTINTPNRMRYEGGQYYLKSPDEMYSLFPYAQEACINTHRIAERCNVEFEFNKYKLPHFEVPDNLTPLDYLTKLCTQGLEKRYGNVTEALTQRLNYELGVISQMGFVDYFLIVWDFIRYAKDNGIPVGPGRGSAAGSIVAYTLGITDIDPLKFDLIFERFLNPERVSMPDIDIDFCYERRHEVIEYVNSKYGSEQVAQIITFGTMAARNAIRDVGRALDMPYADVDKIAKLIPMELNITIADALNISPDLKSAYDSDTEVKRLIDMSMKLEGLPRHTSTHAAGVIIADRPVVDYVPLNLNTKDNSVTTQYIMTTCEELGLLKMDFLGLRTLTVIHNALNMIERNHGIHYDTSKLDYNDSAVYELISSGHTLGVFQLESAGMMSFMKELKPTNLEDVIAGISLYRPGPMDFIPKYIKGKNSSGNIQYTHPALEPILKNTYGCIVYQEQVMQIVQELGGYTLGRSDMVRRAMSKKKAAVMAKEREIFINGDEANSVPGCIKNGIPQDVANKIFDEMTDFAKYAFNKSHAAAYAVVAYQTAWLKTHYPVEFMASLMSSVMDRPDKISQYIYNCKAMDIDILPPDVNKSYGSFSVEDGKIRFGLSAIKNVGKGNIEAICRIREQDGKYISLTQFLDRLSSSLNTRTIESLILSGALDSLGGKRSQYMTVYKNIYDGLVQSKRNNIEGQLNIFELDSTSAEDVYRDEFPDIDEYDTLYKLSKEKEVIGIYVSGHPLDRYANELKRHISNTTHDLPVSDEDYTNPNKLKDGDKVIMGGIITATTVKYTKNGKQMAFFTIEDITGSVEILVFPNTYEEVRSVLSEEEIVLVTGRASISEDQPPKLIAERVTRFADITASSHTLWIKLPDNSSLTPSDIQSVLSKYKGQSPVILYLESTKQKLAAGRGSYVNITDQLLEELKGLVGEKSVVVK
jgi:DNA polymerase-3 subunit alpha